MGTFADAAALQIPKSHEQHRCTCQHRRRTQGRPPGVGRVDGLRQRHDAHGVGDSHLGQHLQHLRPAQSQGPGDRQDQGRRGRGHQDCVQGSVSGAEYLRDNDPEEGSNDPDKNRSDRSGSQTCTQLRVMNGHVRASHEHHEHEPDLGQKRQCAVLRMHPLDARWTKCDPDGQLTQNNRQVPTPGKGKQRAKESSQRDHREGFKGHRHTPSIFFTAPCETPHHRTFNSDEASGGRPTDRSVSMAGRAARGSRPDYPGPLHRHRSKSVGWSP